MDEILYISHEDGGPELILNKDELLLEALETIVKEYPPLDTYAPPSKGLWNGPSGIAYLFLHVSAERPDLHIANQTALHWADAYLAGTRDAESMSLRAGVRCGITSELLVHQAVRASLTKDVLHVEEFLLNIPAVLAGRYDAEWFSGRAGTLYLLRMIRHWVPESAPLLRESTFLLRATIMAEGPDWKWRGKRSIGAGHGDIGTLTQVALSSPTDAEHQKLEEWLARLLDWQKENGNWPVNEQRDPRAYVQFCHGAPGFVTSLRSLRPVFPNLQDRIDRALLKAGELIWKEGLLKKEPNLCHGAFGNSL